MQCEILSYIYPPFCHLESLQAASLLPGWPLVPTLLVSLQHTLSYAPSLSRSHTHTHIQVCVNHALKVTKQHPPHGPWQMAAGGTPLSKQELNLWRNCSRPFISLKKICGKNKLCIQTDEVIKENDNKIHDKRWEIINDCLVKDCESFHLCGVANCCWFYLATDNQFWERWKHLPFWDVQRFHSMYLLTLFYILSVHL